MKVNGLSVSGLNLEAKPSIKKKNKNKITSGFLRVFETEKPEEIEKKAFLIYENGEFNLDLIKEYLDEINDVGEKLLTEPSRMNVLNYKKAISSFLNLVIPFSLSLKAQTGTDQKLIKRPKYTVINLINEKLDKLVLSVLQNQLPQIGLLNSLEEIRGLLVDLVR